ncbi:MAG: MBL fold metallo-hydrolase [Desulfopila sp.]|nr:MBL fold metallo-hydrolase [Desulfopila sp.]
MKYSSVLFKIHLAVIVFLAGCSVNTAGTPDSADTLCYFFDVGEGAAALIDSPELGRILIDTGNPTSRLVSKLSGMGVTSVDTVIVTHPHPDHIGGIHNVLEFLSPQAIYDNGEPLTFSDPMQRWYHENVRLDPRYALLQAGDRIEKDNSVLEVLAPYQLTGNWNENSLVLLFSIGHWKVLFMADATYATEEILLQNKDDLSADILQVGHHGSHISSSERFLAEVRPRFAVISVNIENINGYPSSRTIARLEMQGAEVLCTCDQGDIVFAVNPATQRINLIRNERDD